MLFRANKRTRCLIWGQCAYARRMTWVLLHRQWKEKGKRTSNQLRQKRIPLIYGVEANSIARHMTGSVKMSYPASKRANAPFRLEKSYLKVLCYSLPSFIFTSRSSYLPYPSPASSSIFCIYEAQNSQSAASLNFTVYGSIKREEKMLTVRVQPCRKSRSMSMSRCQPWPTAKSHLTRSQTSTEASTGTGCKAAISQVARGKKRSRKIRQEFYSTENRWNLQ